MNVDLYHHVFGENDAFVHTMRRFSRILFPTIESGHFTLVVLNMARMNV